MASPNPETARSASRLAVLLVPLAVVGLGGCGTSPTDRDGAVSPVVATPSDDAPPPRLTSIEGTWRVQEVVGPLGAERPPADSGEPVTITFAPMVNGRGDVSGFAGVNRIRGSYGLGAGEAEVAAISFGSLISTRRAGPPNAMAFEQSLLAALEAGRTIARVGGGLVIEGGELAVRLAPR
jgi:heat shock protein HslJ